MPTCVNRGHESRSEGRLRRMNETELELEFIAIRTEPILPSSGHKTEREQAGRYERKADVHLREDEWSGDNRKEILLIRSLLFAHSNGQLTNKTDK